MKAHCLFEQSGTFKNEFKKLGVDAYDYDILNDFGETDYQIDLYKEIENAYENKPSIFDNISPDDVVLAFFPCIRFEVQIILWYKGQAMQQKNWSDEKKLEKDLELHKELHHNYELITKLSIIALRKNLKLIIENPYSTQHYLTRYWAIEPKIVDEDRTRGGDYMKKPTQYWFINCEPKCNLLMDEPYFISKERRTHQDMWGEQVKRSMIHPEYAKRFIREYIL